MTLPSTADNLVPERWRLSVRLFWIATAVILFGLHSLGLKYFYQELVTVCTSPACKILQFSRIELAVVADLDWDQYTFAVYYLVLEGVLALLFSVLAILVFWRRSDTWVGIVVSLAFLFVGLVFFAEENRSLARVIPELQLFTDFLTSISVVMMLMLFYLFPDGRFRPRWMRWFAAALFAVVFLEPFLNQGGVRMSSASAIVIITFGIGVSMGLVSQIYRFRKVSNASQRQQTKWILFGFLAMFAGMFPWMIFAEINPIQPGVGRLIFYLSLIPQYILIGFFPVAVVIAIMRYRLFDIDIIIRKTLQYALLTGLLALVYFGSVILLQSLTENLVGEQSPLVIVFSTLAIAVLFNPLRTRIQDFIDRRFYRKKYNAEQALAQFAATARDEVELEKLTAALLSVVNETMQPEKVSMWMLRSRKE